MDGDDAGRIVDGRFELVEQLVNIEGASGAAWRARDVDLRREVVAKRVPFGAAGDEEPPAAEERALRESRALAGLGHPHAATVLHLAVDRADSALWVVMERVAGRSLAARLAEGPLAPAEAATFGRQVLSALRAAHGAGLRHGDVRPEHVILRPEGGAVLTGFLSEGVRRAEASGDAGAFPSPEYLAPELIRGGDAGPAADLWALGMLLYVSVEGAHPSRRPTAMATLAAVLDGPPPATRAGALAPVLAALLVADPAARPSGERLDALLGAALAGGEPPATVASPVPSPPGPALPAPPHPPTLASAPPPPPAGPPPAPAVPAAGGRRWPAVVAGGVVVAALAVAVAVPALNSSSDDEDTAKGGGRPGASQSPAEEGDAPAPGENGESEESESAEEIGGVRVQEAGVYRHELGASSEAVPYDWSGPGPSALSVTVHEVETGEPGELSADIMDPVQSEGLKPVYLHVSLENLGGQALTVTSSGWVGHLGTFTSFEEGSVPTASSRYAFGVDGGRGDFGGRHEDQMLPVGQSADFWVIAAVPADEDPTLVYWKPDWDPMANGWVLWEIN
ncbi:Serine/threonine protein kinase [Streptomyces zhaozhouensis]|uniref:non-specific serine/threonine protein kinase n=1 Tax=Streptomyces zhaozhouensis TaxID=1300267 RepID=A0A286E0E1_9ACTN|nr:serine/threonine-protein kinase [Streptomyces zhaozhouensis]SOD64362.1 Serine/threonine protein kinase [Streptomyces zhaozhouensis]